MSNLIKKKNNQDAFLALVRAGLWEKDVWLSQFGQIDFNEVYRLAEEQSVVGLVAAGIEHVKDVKVPQQIALTFVGGTLQIEQRNLSMNEFAIWLINRLNDNSIKSLIVKGQGVAQCYERPHWRSSGDIDLLLDADNYEKAKIALFPLADSVDKEEKEAKHQALNIKGFEIELHGRMPFFLSRRVDSVIDSVLNDSLNGGHRIWRTNNTEIYLPKPDNDVIIIFTHFLFHFFIEGVGLRQICDWCRLLWLYRNEVNQELLEKRLQEMGLVSEWKTFAALAVKILGMPGERMPLYDNNPRYIKKAYKALNHILKCGNMGHNNDLSYRMKYKGLGYKLVTFWRRLCDFVGFNFIFPIDAPKFFFSYVFDKVR